MEQQCDVSAAAAKVDFEVLKKELLCQKVYISGSCATKALQCYPSMTYAATGLLLADQKDPTVRAVGLWAVGRSLPRSKHRTKMATLRNGSCLSEQALYLEAIVSDPMLSYAYSALGTTIGPDEFITLHDGRCFSKQQLYLEAVSLNPTVSSFYYNLAKG